MNLAEIQRRVVQMIKRNPSNSSDLVRPMGSASPQTRIDVYCNAYATRMTESLRDDFGRVCDLLDTQEFENLAQEFTNEYPSRYASLAEFSKHFPQYLKVKSPNLYRAASLDWLEILSSYTCGYDLKKAISAQEIKEGVEYLLLKNPTLYASAEIEDPIIFYRKADQVVSLQISELELRILSLLASPQPPDIFLDSAQLQGIDLKLTLETISKWIAAEVLYCERKR